MSAILVTNIAPSATEENLSEFFSTAGDIKSIELKPGDGTKYATVIFAEKEAVNAAVMLNGCLVLNYALSITALPHVPEPGAEQQQQQPSGAQVQQPAIDVATAELSPFENKIAGFFGKTIVAGKKAVEAVKEFDREKGITAGAKAKISEFDSKHEISSKVKGTVTAIDEKHNISAKAKEGVAEANQKLRDIDEQLKITETTKKVAAEAKEKAMQGWQKAMENDKFAQGVNTLWSGWNTAWQKAKKIATTAQEAAGVDTGAPTVTSAFGGNGAMEVPTGASGVGIPAADVDPSPLQSTRSGSGDLIPTGVVQQAAI